MCILFSFTDNPYLPLYFSSPPLPPAFSFLSDQHWFYPGRSKSLQADNRPVRQHCSRPVQQTPDGGAASSYVRRGQWVLPLPVEERWQSVCPHQVRGKIENAGFTLNENTVPPLKNYDKLTGWTWKDRFKCLFVSFCPGVFSGESGAGKTESTKLLLKFLSVMSQNSAGTPLSERTTRVEQALIQSRYCSNHNHWPQIPRSQSSGRLTSFLQIICSGIC